MEETPRDRAENVVRQWISEIAATFSTRSRHLLVDLVAAAIEHAELRIEDEVESRFSQEGEPIIVAHVKMKNE